MSTAENYLSNLSSPICVKNNPDAEILKGGLKTLELYFRDARKSEFQDNVMRAYLSLNFAAEAKDDAWMIQLASYPILDKLRERNLTDKKLPFTLHPSIQEMKVECVQRLKKSSKIMEDWFQVFLSMQFLSEESKLAYGSIAVERRYVDYASTGWKIRAIDNFS